MTPIERLELFAQAMEQKYGFLFPLRMDVRELRQHCELIDFAKEWKVTNKLK